MRITGTLINYYFICHRKLWLFARGMGMEYSSDLVDQGRLIGESSYARHAERYREVKLDNLRIDRYDPKRKVVHEIKKSNSYEEAHVWQVKFYIHELERLGVAGVRGLVEYPRQRKTTRVRLMDADRHELEALAGRISEIADSLHAPDRIAQRRCGPCAYFDFCWVREEEG